MYESSGVGRGVGARSPADRSLVDNDRLIDMLQAFDGVMRSGGRVLNVVAFGVESFDEDAVDEGTLAGT